jgi:hypothetical protein
MWILHKLVYKVWPNFSLEFEGYRLLLLSLLTKNLVHVIFGEMLLGNMGMALKIFSS